MQFGLIIIGDEILSGKRQDKHFAKVLELFDARGLQLSWVQYLGDDRGRLIAALERSFASDDVVLSCGGIGATPDDHTRQAAAAALGRPLVLHPEAERLITERTMDMARAGAQDGKVQVDMTLPENRQRLKMGEFPEGARIIPNPFNKIPGFNVGQHWFVPGFPVMAWPMLEMVLDQHYAHLFFKAAAAEQSFLVHELAESTVTPLMERIEQQFKGVRTFSLPSVGGGGIRRHIELGVKGDAAQVPDAFEQLRTGVIELGGQPIPMNPGGEPESERSDV